jgi:transporter family-2 protein
MWILFLIFAFLAGLALPIQFSIMNAQLRIFSRIPLVAATISFIVGAITLFTISLFKAGFSFNKGIASAPWWVWTGGVLGAFYVLATIILIPRIGAGTTVALVLAGQIVASVLIDHFGLINVPIHLLSLPRILGAILVIIGVVLIQKF